ncbi:MAG: hypothetical protein IJZ42_10505, partial [Lachnospiraceae bacterium]|nr:hypothetical protein [Lachnospiraceae bacterium]
VTGSRPNNLKSAPQTYASIVCVPSFILPLLVAYLNFQGWIAVYLSRYFVAFRSRNGFILAYRFDLVNNFFKLFLPPFFGGGIKL